MIQFDVYCDVSLLIFYLHRALVANEGYMRHYSSNTALKLYTGVYYAFMSSCLFLSVKVRFRFAKLGYDE